MRLETKLGFSTGVLICVMLLIAGTAHMRIQDASRISGTITGSRMPVIMATRDARLHMTRSIMDLQSYMLFRGDPEAAQTFRVDRAAQIERLTNNINSLEHAKSELDLGDDALKLSVMEEQAGLLKNLQEQIEGLVDTRVPANRAKADSLLQKELIPGSRQMFQAAMQLSDSQRNKARADALQLQHTNKLTLLTLWIATVLGAIVGAIISILLGRHITEALEQVSRRANAIAGGDLTGEELMLETGDQIGALAVAMNRMQGALGSILGTVADTAGSLTGSAASMRSASDQIHRRIDQQSQQTQQAATAMQEMSASIAEVSRHTHSAAETARSAAQTARDGGTIVKRMLGSMQQIATAVSETSETVGLLGEDSKRISQIVTVINEIARKTNLLALNAAIEAARAGDQGRGFAVVAGEVRRLAESTAQATGEIGEMIAGIQQRTHQAIASMESGTGMVLEGVGTTTRAGEALERIIGMAEQVDRMITQIAIAASQQATAADQSSASLDSIHMLSHDNLNEMATTAAGIESLRGTAVTLEKQVDRFQVMHA